MSASTSVRGTRRRGARALALGALVALVATTPLLVGVLAQPVHADDNVPIYTSPIDVTSGRFQFRAVAPDRDTGNPVEVPVPIPPGPKLNQLMSTPLGTQMDQFWNVTPDKDTGKTPRQMACDGNTKTGQPGITSRVEDQVGKIGGGFSAYDVSCNLATTGTVLAQQVGSVVYLAYLIPNNVVEFTATTPYTCHSGHGTFLCPDDPRFSVTFAVEIWTVIRAPDICHVTADGGTVDTLAVNIDSHNFSGDVAKIIDPLVLGNKFSAAEQAISATEQQTPLPVDGSLQELRDSGPCTDRNHPAYSTVAAFRDMETEIDPVQGIIFRASHPAIAAPRLDGPNPGGAPAPPDPPSFLRPDISAQPVVVAGSQVQVNGSTFPPTVNLADRLPLTLDRDGNAACNGGATELEWGPAGGQKQVQRLPADSNFSTCAYRYEITNLTPATAYQFRARDCDMITCSPWSAPLNATTATADPDRGKVTLSLDDGTALGSSTINDQGTFEATVTIPADTTAGPHTIHAVSGDARAELSVQVTAAGPGGGPPTMVLTGSYYGETGCPIHPLPEYAQKITTDEQFSLFGSAFAAGTVEVHLDSVTGMSLGTATVGADGTFCQDFQGPPTSQLGDHTLVALQNGTVQVSIPVAVILPSVIH